MKTLNYLKTKLFPLIAVNQYYVFIWDIHDGDNL